MSGEIRLTDAIPPPFCARASQSLRLLTSAYIRANEHHFAPFLMHPETFQPIDVAQFCLSEVEPTGKEADSVQIQALARCLKQGLRICYLDGGDPGLEGNATNDSSGMEDIGKVNFVVEFELAEGEGVGQDPLMLLYRCVSKEKAEPPFKTDLALFVSYSLDMHSPGHYDVLTKDRPPTS